MGKSGKLSGGGLESNKLVETRNPKSEPISHSVSMNRPSLIGASTFFKKPPLYNKVPFSTSKGPSDMSLQGPGAGRRILPSGSQSSVKAPTPMSGPRRSLFK
jgi:hypothetical protein